MYKKWDRVRIISPYFSEDFRSRIWIVQYPSNNYEILGYCCTSDKDLQERRDYMKRKFLDDKWYSEDYILINSKSLALYDEEIAPI